MANRTPSHQTLHFKLDEDGFLYEKGLGALGHGEECCEEGRYWMELIEILQKILP